ncbi:DUF4229 domain-containing protein [Brevibacterium spongiae]|uniref:DUF4229 domain-containing protein n=1 Tax=Brevibacterium spongiae TaxID=2909672 RepID=A0ABY5SRK1_9MICO|nr:DUF4229 domain-containing protein [Brevibacterium spongiae]UVI37132.1 DUF4229 domain-containing protein [Brevibacterium spongiae]
MRTFWLYTFARLGIIIAVGLILFPFLGFNMVMALAAIIIGALLSYLFLGRMRAQVATDIEERVAKRAAKPERKGADEEAEDQIIADRVGENDSVGKDEDTSK